MSNTEFTNDVESGVDENYDPANFQEVKSGEEITLDEAKGVVEYNYRAPNILMEEGWMDLPAEERARYMHKLANAMNHAAKLLQDERNELLKINEVLRQQVANAEQNLMAQKTINQVALTQQNTQMQENAIRTGHLQSRIKQLETVVKAAGLSLD